MPVGELEIVTTMVVYAVVLTPMLELVRYSQRVTIIVAIVAATILVIGSRIGIELILESKTKKDFDKTQLRPIGSLYSSQLTSFDAN